MVATFDFQKESIVFNPKATYGNIAAEAQSALLTIAAAFGGLEPAYVQSDISRQANATKPISRNMQQHKTSNQSW
jgi:hypothetical protein